MGVREGIDWKNDVEKGSKKVDGNIVNIDAMSNDQGGIGGKHTMPSMGWL